MSGVCILESRCTPGDDRIQDVLALALIGPAGAGKSTVGRSLADALGWGFTDADAFHSAANLARLARGEALSDADRAPWLTGLRREIATAVACEQPVQILVQQIRRSCGVFGAPASSPRERQY